LGLPALGGLRLTFPNAATSSPSPAVGDHCPNEVATGKIVEKMKKTLTTIASNIT